MPPLEGKILRELSSVYGLTSLHRITPLSPNTASRVWRLTAGEGDLLLRTLSGPCQGRREWAIFQHLSRQGFHRTPAILSTENGAPMAEVDGVWYQVQRFCPGCVPDPAQPGTARSVACLAVCLSQALSGCPPVDEEALFDLAAVWSGHRGSWPRLALPLSLAEADRAVASLSAIPARDEQLIHGDLGPWNLLHRENGDLWVIDLGQARLGDPYFDLATALAGLVNHTPVSRRHQVADEFLTECDRLILLDRPRLRDQLRLWAWQGLARCVRSMDQGSKFWNPMAPRFYSALIWAEEDL